MKKFMLRVMPVVLVAFLMLAVVAYPSVERDVFVCAYVLKPDEPVSAVTVLAYVL